MDFSRIMDYLFYRGSIAELQTLNQDDYTRGITYHSMLYLNIIAFEENCTVSRLAELLNITTSAAVIKVNELERQGFVEKSVSAEDKRVRLLRLTYKTREIYEQYTQISAKTLEQLKSKYSNSQLELFIQILKEIAEYEPEN
jgi:DNA-binding MarR family transcriptional regulator